MDFPNTSFFIGSHLVSPPLVMAPLHEITDKPWRRMIRELGGVGLTVSEMISCEALIRQARKAEQMLRSEGEQPFAIQLAGYVPEHLGEAARVVEESGADLVDLNMGCPASNVTKGGAGSALLKDFRHAKNCLSAITRSVKIPVTVKMRVGWDAAQKERNEYLDFIRMFEDLGIAALTIHPRTRAQQYTGEADWSLIARAVELAPRFPIIGNGDVKEAADAHRLVRETGCQGVMIGRAAMTNPWIFRQVMEPDFHVTELERIDLCIRYFRMLEGLFDAKESLHKMKKIGSWFTKGIRGGVHFRQALNGCHDGETLLHELEALRATALEIP